MTTGTWNCLDQINYFWDLELLLLSMHLSPAGQAPQHVQNSSVRLNAWKRIKIKQKYLHNFAAYLTKLIICFVQYVQRDLPPLRLPSE